MKTKSYLIGIIILLINGCYVPGNMPAIDKIDVFEYGSHITILYKQPSNLRLSGELIALENDTIIVLSSLAKKCKSIPITDVRKFTLTYATPKQYGMTIPLFSLMTLTHGWFLIFTLPINLAVTLIATSSALDASQYTNKNLTYEDLKMFARFPQGIPPGIELDSIK